MEKIGTRQICATFMGCFLGAGFVSGQELWQYFGCFGIQGILGLFTACLLLTGLGLILLLTAGMSGTGEMDRVVIPSDIPWLRGVTGAVQISFMFGIYTVMVSGAGTLIESQTGSHLARILGSAVFCAIVTVISLGGVEAVVKIFGRVVPVLVMLTIVTALIVIGKNGIARIEVTADAASNPLLGNWGIAAANFTSYNFSAPSVRWRRSAWPTVQGNRPLKAYYRAACSCLLSGSVWCWQCIPGRRRQTHNCQS